MSTATEVAAGKAWDQLFVAQHGVRTRHAMRPRARKYLAYPNPKTKPVITGTPTTTHVLTVSQGQWTNSPTSYAYAWYRDNVAISGATAATYTVAAADVGHVLKAGVTATNAKGSNTAFSSTAHTIKS